jgi:PAS domain S-box-containing protein
VETIRIALVEDNPGDARLIRELLMEGVQNLSVFAGFELHHYDRLSLALPALATTTVDVVLLDLSLPDSHGLETVRRMRDAMPETPIIVLSALDDEVFAAQAVAEGAQDYLVKGYVHEYMFLRVIRYAIERKQAENALRDSEARFRALIENSSDAIATVSEDGTILYMSPATSRILGYSPDEMRGNSVFALIHPEDQEDTAALMGQLLQMPGGTVTTELRLSHRDGSWRWIECIGRNLLREVGVQALVVNNRDITERKLSEQALQHKVDTLQSLAEIDREIIEATGISSILDLVCRSAAELVHASRAAISTGSSPAEMRLAAFHGLTLSGFGNDELHDLWDEAPRWENDGIHAADEPDGRDNDDARPSRTAGATLRVGSKMLGLLLVCDDEPRVWSSDELRLLDLLAGQAAIAIEKERLFTETEQRAREFAALYEITRDLTAHQELETLLQTVMERASALIGASGGGIYLFDAAREELELVVTEGEHTPARGSTLRPGESIAGQVAQTRSPMLVDDYQKWPERAPQFEGYPIGAVISVPMLYAGELVGVLTLSMNSASTRRFSDSDAHLLSLFAAQAASAVHSASQFEEKTQRLGELEAINRVSSVLSSTTEVEELLPRLLDEALHALDTDAGMILLVDHERDELAKAVRRGWFTSLEVLPRRHHSIAAHVLATGEAYAIREFRTDPYIAEEARDHCPEGWGGACIPIHNMHESSGVLYLAVPHPRQLTPQELSLLSTLTEMAGIAIHRLRLREQTEQRLQRLTALRAIDNAISSSLDLRVTLNIVLDQVLHQLGVDAADVLLLNPHMQMLEYAAGRGFRGPAISRSQVRVGVGSAGRAVMSRSPITVPDLRAPDVDFTRAHLLTGENLVTYHAVPLIAKGQVQGVLEVFHRSPVRPDPEWLDFLEILAGQTAIAVENAQLFEGLQRSNIELSLAYDATIEGWSRALDLRDKETEGHSQRVTEITLRLARAMGMSDKELVHVRHGALLHDIGKMGIPDTILLKPGPLTDDEWSIMRKHPVYAYDLLSPISFLLPALDIPYCHHEKWDGTGYPNGLKEDQIPLAARIFAVVDVWDALCSDRPYRAAWPAEKARSFIMEQSGKHFDPRVVTAFLETCQPEHDDRAPLLVVADDEELVGMLRESLDATYKLFTAGSGLAALATLENEPADLILFAEWLPDMAGLELLERVRVLSPASVGVLMAAEPDSSTLVQALNLGNVLGHVSNPADVNELQQRLGAALRYAEARRLSRQVAMADAISSIREEPEPLPALLIVDDEENVTRSLARTLRGRFTIHTATSAEQALEILQSRHIDILLSDQRMPGLSGVQLAERGRQAQPELITLLISGYGELPDLVDALNQGNISGYISKPWGVEDLHGRLDEAAQRYQPRNGRRRH